jgi:hypothetical protein
MNEGKATAFVCQDYVCQLPTSDLAILQRIITRNYSAPHPGNGVSYSNPPISNVLPQISLPTNP